MSKIPFKINLQLFAAGPTKIADLINPEVMADMISASLPAAIRFSPLADLDYTLEGRPGDTITVPRYKYVGDAEDVAEGEAMVAVKLETTSDTATVKKAGKAVELTDESVLSGYGDPIGEAEGQIGKSIAAKVDNDTLEALKGTTLTYVDGTAWNLDTVDAAIDKFDDEDQEPMVLIVSPKTAAALRKAAADAWDRASDLGDEIIVKGTYGGLLGAQVVRSRKVEDNEGYLAKRGALKIYAKRGMEVESDRDILKKTTVITGDQHYVVHLYDDSKAVKIEVQG